MNERTNIRVGIICALLSAASVQASVVEFTDFTSWSSQVNPFTTIDFTENFPGFITDQYQALGITFTDGDDVIFFLGPFVTDDFAVDGGFNNLIQIQFSEPQTSFGLSFLGGTEFELFNGADLIFQSPEINEDGIFPPDFFGITSTLSFDRVIISPPGVANNITVDNLYFGTAVPAPGIGALLGLAGLFGRTRRRKRMNLYP